MSSLCLTMKVQGAEVAAVAALFLLCHITGVSSTCPRLAQMFVPAALVGPLFNTGFQTSSSLQIRFIRRADPTLQAVPTPKVIKMPSDSVTCRKCGFPLALWNAVPRDVGS